MLKVVGDDNDVKKFMEKHGIEQREGRFCINCKSAVVYNECFYTKGHAYVRFVHDCDEEYWVTTFVPFTKEAINKWEKVMPDIKRMLDDENPN